MKKRTIIPALLLLVILSGCVCSREPVAVVYGKRIYYSDLDPDHMGESLSEQIHGPVIRKYLHERGLTVSDKELIAFVKDGDEPVPDDILDKEGKIFFRAILESNLFAKSLFDEYGGRVTISSFGFIGALDAQEKFLRKLIQEGKLSILDPALEQKFWETVTNEWGDSTLSEEKAREMFNDPDYPLGLS